MTRNKILIGPSSFAEKDKSPLELLQKNGYSVINNPYGRKLTTTELLQLLQPDVIGLIAGLEKLDREVMKASSLRCISRVGSGMSNVDLIAAKDLNIAVRSTPDGPTQSVAELTLGSLLSLLRLIPEMNEDLHNGKWSKKIGFELRNKLCLVIGFGRIGKRVADFLHAFGADIVVYDPYLQSQIGYRKTERIEEILHAVDVITIHSSGESCLLSGNEFSLMKDGVFILNASRGNAIDEPSLIEALDTKKVRGAWLDTFVEEPYKGPLCRYKNVLLTPHVGSYTLECRREMEMEAVNNLISTISPE
ncbi:MAG: NAD(P)-dependent oxidoreductase [Bacteroidota bacterium]